MHENNFTMKVKIVTTLTCFLLVLKLCNCDVQKMAGMTMDGDDTGGKMSFETPELSDEDAYSMYMPATLKCDGCKIIAKKLTDKLISIHSRRKSKKDLPESDVIEAIESICEAKDVFKDYGVKMVKGIKRLSGPGLETEEEPGIMSGGGKWPGRMHEMCVQYIGEIGEDVIYRQFRKNNNSLEKYLCRGSGLQGYCSNGQPNTKSKEEL